MDPHPRAEGMARVCFTIATDTTLYLPCSRSSLDRHYCIIERLARACDKCSGVCKIDGCRDRVTIDSLTTAKVTSKFRCRSLVD